MTDRYNKKINQLAKIRNLVESFTEKEWTPLLVEYNKFEKKEIKRLNKIKDIL